MEFFNLSPRILIIFGITASLVFSIGVIIGYYGKEGEIDQRACHFGFGIYEEPDAEIKWVKVEFFEDILVD